MKTLVGYAVAILDPYNPPRSEPRLLGCDAHWEHAYSIVARDAQDRDCTVLTKSDPSTYCPWWEIDATGNPEGKGWRYKIVEVRV